MEIIHIPPYTPERNPIEQVWKQIRAIGFKNELFNTLTDVAYRLCETINKLIREMIKSTTYRDWLFW